MRASLSIMGLYNYDNSIFDGLDVPEALEKDTLVDYIMMECANLELLYPSWPIMHRLISAWAAARAHSWERLYQSTVQNYNMIHNFDRYETWQDTSRRTSSGQEATTDSRQSSGSSTTTDSTDTSSSGTTNTAKAAYNDTTLVPTESVTSTATAESEGSGSSNSTSIESGTGSRTSSGTDTEQGGHEGHLYGNIGVTTAAQMLSGERELYKWDVYQAIAQEFKERFCILVY